MNKKEGWEDADLILRNKYKLSHSFRWVPYDPEGFIIARRFKYRLLGYKHCKYPHIEKYANQQEWQQDTLIEKLTEEETMLKNVRELEKTLDLDSMQQVPFKRTHSAGEGTSASRTAPATQAPSTGAPRTDKGKGIMGAEEETVKEKPAPSSEQLQERQQGQQQGQQQEQPQEQTPPPQAKAQIAPIMQTPAQEERGTKRDREESTPTSGSSQQPHTKRQRADSPEVEDITEEILDSSRKDREGS